MKRKPMTRAEKAMLKLWRSRTLCFRDPPHGADCQGQYWILRVTRTVWQFRAECAKLAKEHATN